MLTLKPPNPVKKGAEGSSVSDPGPAGVTPGEGHFPSRVCPEGRQSWPDCQEISGFFFPLR